MAKDKKEDIKKQAAKAIKSSTKKEDKKQKRFWKDYKSELKKVRWPTSKELLNSTAAVLTIVIVVAVIVILLDLAFEHITKAEVKGIEALQNTSLFSNTANEATNELSAESLNSLGTSETVDENTLNSENTAGSNTDNNSDSQGNTESNTSASTETNIAENATE